MQIIHLGWKLLTLKEDIIKTKGSSTLPNKNLVFFFFWVIQISQRWEKELLYLESSKGMEEWFYVRNIHGI